MIKTFKCDCCGLTSIADYKSFKPFCKNDLCNSQWWNSPEVRELAFADYLIKSMQVDNKNLGFNTFIDLDRLNHQLKKTVEFAQNAEEIGMQK